MINNKNNSIREYIVDHILIFDGAMGSLYLEKYSGACELANLNHREVILQIHKEYIEAGAKAIKTNTFGANTCNLSVSKEELREIIILAVDLAKEAVGDKDIYIFADMGPITDIQEHSIEEYKFIIDVFLSQGIDCFIFETLSTDEYLKEICEYIREKCQSAYIISQFAVAPDGFTRLGLSGKNIINRMIECAEIDAVGFNCISGSHHLAKYLKQFNKEDKKFSVMPNAGYPSMLDNRLVFGNASDFFAKNISDMVNDGVKIVGGCCGTNPLYIKKIVEGLASYSPTKLIKYRGMVKSIKDVVLPENELLLAMKKGEKIIAVELDPPMNTDIEFFMEGANRLKQQGVNAITIADCPLAKARVDSSLLACKLKRELDITPIPHMTCRDRNLNATKALLLGLNIEGVENVLVVTGDPVPSPMRDEIKTMFSFNSAILAKHISELNNDVFVKPFGIYGAININAVNFQAQLNQAKKKVANGVTVLFTQPVLSEEAFHNLIQIKKELDVKVMGGIIPIVSHRNANFMNNEIAGINVSEDIIRQYEGIDKEEATKLAIKLSVEIAKKITDYVDGYYIITPFRRVDIVEQIIKEIREF